MKYLIVLYARYNDGAADKKAIYEAMNESSAISSFHSYMGSYMNNSAVSNVLCFVITENGGLIKNESWYRPIEKEGTNEEL